LKSKETVRLTRLSPRGLVRLDDVVASEPLVIYVNEKPLVSLFCTPEALRELAAGFLYSSGILRDRKEAASAEIEVKEKSIWVKMDRPLPETLALGLGSGCGGSLVFGPTGLIAPLEAGVRVSPEMIFPLVEEFQSRALIFKETGGTHCAAVCRPEEILFFSEDIGRHNAVDKVIGQALLGGTPLEDKLLLLSGRIAYDIAVKAARAESSYFPGRPTSAALAFWREDRPGHRRVRQGNASDIYTPGEIIL
jgi:FdhD protein